MNCLWSRRLRISLENLQRVYNYRYVVVTTQCLNYSTLFVSWYFYFSLSSFPAQAQTLSGPEGLLYNSALSGNTYSIEIGPFCEARRLRRPGDANSQNQLSLETDFSKVPPIVNRFESIVYTNGESRPVSPCSWYILTTGCWSRSPSPLPPRLWLLLFATWRATVSILPETRSSDACGTFHVRPIRWEKTAFVARSPAPLLSVMAKSRYGLRRPRPSFACFGDRGRSLDRCRRRADLRASVLVKGRSRALCA